MLLLYIYVTLHLFIKNWYFTWRKFNQLWCTANNYTFTSARTIEQLFSSAYNRHLWRGIILFQNSWNRALQGTTSPSQFCLLFFVKSNATLECIRKALYMLSQLVQRGQLRFPASH